MEGLRNSSTPIERQDHADNAPAGTNGDISSWVNANLKRLERFVDRELRFRVATGQIRRDQITREEVIDEVIMNALSEEHGTPEQLGIFRPERSRLLVERFLDRGRSFQRRDGI